MLKKKKKKKKKRYQSFEAVTKFAQQFVIILF